MISLLMAEWSHLIDDNLFFFAPRFTLYRNAISAKYIELYGVMDPKYEFTSLFTDGTQR